LRPAGPRHPRRQPLDTRRAPSTHIAGDAKFFIADQKFIISSLHTWGWVTLILGVLQLIAGFSLFSGGGFGRWFGMLAAGRADRMTLGSHVIQAAE
jgi:hypothetical protein